ncbi:flagellar hook-associated protein FlgK [Marivita sp. S0852]|uniref:flagellar hook-associated protein FlgK n=1 Tax=Marivita sp. S0852 TaxID=3373893 RepID=UPI0039822648
MSLSGALSNAISGLTANTIGTSTLSANVANALNENYGRRTVNLTTNVNQSYGGVRVTQIERFSDPVLNHQKRLASASFAEKQTLSKFSVEFENLWGSVDTITSMSKKLTKFETALLSASSDPSSDIRLRAVGQAADTLANGIKSASKGVQAVRTTADHQIASAVDTINTQLSQLERLNIDIMSARHRGQDMLSLIDSREKILNDLSEFIPLRVIERDSGAIAIFSNQGRTLLDVKATQFNFTKSQIIQPEMTIENGLLSDLTEINVTNSISLENMFSGGKLSALFEVRDTIAPRSQARLDAIAREMIERFGHGGGDNTITPGDLGVFTDAGAVFNASNEVGLASRLSLNENLLPESNELFKWRDGLYATTIGAVGNSSLLEDIRGQILSQRLPSSAILGLTAKTLIGHVENFSEFIASNRNETTEATDLARQQFDMYNQAHAKNGVNSDEELQKLIILEKSFAANARIIQVVDEMLTDLLQI